jgi:hypothetical protein
LRRSGPLDLAFGSVSMYHSFYRVQAELHRTPGMKAYAAHELWDTVNVVQVIEAWDTEQVKSEGKQRRA